MESKKINQLATEMSPAATDLTIIGDPTTGVSKKITLEQIASLFAGSVSFYANLAAFPVTGTIDTIYCAKDTNKLYLWSGSAYVQTFPSQALLDTYQLRSEKGASNGYASLDSAGKVPVAQLPSSIMEYKGMWSAATNTPTLANGTGDTGDVYICNAAGSVNFGAGSITFAVGDYVIYSGSIWQRSSGAVGTVTSVAASITGDSIGITGSPITTSGTLAFAFAGTNLQYINGAGNLTTFPTLTGYVPYSGATANVNLGEYGLSGGFIGFDTTPTSTPTAQGTMYWNADKESVDVIMNGVTGSVMQDTFYNVKNQTGATITKGTIVRANGTVGASGRILIAPFLADGSYDSKVCLGVTAETILNGEDGKVTAFGAIRQIDTSAFANGTILYASPTTAGGFTSTEPTNPSNIVTIAIVVYSDVNNGEIFVRPTFVDNAADIAASLGYIPQAQLNGTGFVKASGTTITYDNSTYALDSAVVHNTGNETIGGTKTFSDATKNNGGIFLQNASSNSLAGYMNLGGLTNGVKFTSGGGISNTFTLPSATGYTFTFPNATGTLALTSDISYPVTSVFGRTGAVVATNGDYTTAQVTEVTNLYYTDTRARLALSFAAGSGAYNSTTGVITIPTNNNQITNGAGYITGNQTITLSGDVSGSGTTAITTTIGALKVTNAMLAGSIDLTTKVTGLLPDGNISSAATWNAKQNAITLTTTGTSGAATLVGATLNIPQYTDAYTGTVTSVAALTIGTTGTDLSSSVANSTTTPVITLNVPTASATNRGVLSSADWTTFNNKQSALTNPVTGTGTTNYLPKFTGTSTIGNSNLINDASGNLGLGTATPTSYISRFIEVSNATSSGIKFTGATSGLNVGVSIGYIVSDKSFRITNYETTGEIRLETQDLTRATITAAGRLLLGTTTESTYLLDVNGTGRFSDSVYSSGSLQVAPTTGTGMIGVGDNFGGNMNAGIYRGGLGVTTSGNYLNIGGYDGVVVTTGNAALGSQTVRLTIASTGAATFSSSVTADSGFISNNDSNTPAGFYKLKPSAIVATARWWKITSDNIVYGDFCIAQSSANSDASYTNKLYFNATGAATFSSSVTATYGYFSGTGLGAFNSQITLNNTTSSPALITFQNTVNGHAFGFNSTGTSRFTFINGGLSEIAYITSLGAATFSSSVTADSFVNTSVRYIANQIQSGFNDNSDNSDIWINYSGYQGGTTWFRDFRIGNGKNGQIAMFKGSSGNVLIGTTDDGGKVVSYTTNAATQIKAAGTAPAITFSNTVLSPTIGGVLGVCTAASQFFTGTASSDMVLANQFSVGGLIFGTSNLERMRISVGGNLLVGSPTDDTVNRLQVTGTAKATNHITTNGTTSVPTATATTLFAAPQGTIIVTAYNPSDGTFAVSLVFRNIGFTQDIVLLKNGGTGVLTLSGANVQFYHAIGATTNIIWRYIAF